MPPVLANGKRPHSLPKDPLLYLRSHSRIRFDRHDSSTVGEDPDGEITGPGTDFEDDIGGFEIRLTCISLT